MPGPVAVETTLVLVKPDGVRRGLCGEVVARLERRGYELRGARLIRITKTLARQHYAEHDGKPFFGSLLEFITSGPVVAAVVEGERAIAAFRPIAGGTDPVEKAVQLRHLTTLATVDARLIREYRVTSEGLAADKSRLEARQKELTSLRSEVDEERAEADREVAKRQVLLARVKDERAYHDRMVGELSEATRRLEALVRDLQEKQRRAAAKAAPPARSWCRRERRSAPPGPWHRAPSSPAPRRA